MAAQVSTPTPSLTADAAPVKVRSLVRELMAYTKKAYQAEPAMTSSQGELPEFRWAAVRQYCSVLLLVDTRQGKVYRFSVELPDTCAQ